MTLKSKGYEDRVVEAAKDYLDRKARKKNPAGHFDNGGRWYPDEEERCLYCGGIRSPSRSYPYSLLNHCRSADHLAEKHDVLRADVLKCAKRIKKEGGE